MLWFLRILFSAIIAVMLVVTIRASLAQAIFDIPPEVTGNPWFHATLADAYLAFLTFYVWVAWKERSAAARVLWFVAIMLWGNIAMAAYVLGELFRVRTTDALGEVIVTRRPGRTALPAVLAAIGAIAYLLGAGSLFAS